MKGIVLIKIRTGEVELVVRDLFRIDAVVDAFMTFGPYDAVAIIEAENLNAIGNIVYNQIQPIPGITQTLTCLAVGAENNRGTKRIGARAKEAPTPSKLTFGGC